MAERRKRSPSRFSLVVGSNLDKGDVRALLHDANATLGRAVKKRAKLKVATKRKQLDERIEKIRRWRDRVLRLRVSVEKGGSTSACGRAHGWPPTDWEGPYWPINNSTIAIRQWVDFYIGEPDGVLRLWAVAESKHQPLVSDAGDVVRDAWRLVRHCADKYKLADEPDEPPTRTCTPHEALDHLRKAARWFEEHFKKGSGKPKQRSKRSTAKGDARAKIIAALTKHHKYADGGCLNQQPIGVNELARLANAGSPNSLKASVSRFFTEQFGSHTKYEATCRDPAKLSVALKNIAGDLRPREYLFGRRPAGEGQPDQDE